MPSESREYPVLFSAPMVLALLADRKHVTRRLDPQWLKVKAGDKLWVRENFKLETLLEDIPAGTFGPGCKDPVKYLADGFVRGEPIDSFGRTRTSRFMPRWASRILLECTEDARMEPLHAITEDEAQMEGVVLPVTHDGYPCLNLSKRVDSHPLWRSPKTATLADYWTGYFALLWNDLHREPGTTWADNPDVCRIGRFERIR